MLKKRNEDLLRRNKKLVAQVARLKALHSKADGRLNMPATPHDSANFDESGSFLLPPYDAIGGGRAPSIDESSLERELDEEEGVRDETPSSPGSSTLGESDLCDL